MFEFLAIEKVGYNREKVVAEFESLEFTEFRELIVDVFGGKAIKICLENL